MEDDAILRFLLNREREVAAEYDGGGVYFGGGSSRNASLIMPFRESLHPSTKVPEDTRGNNEETIR